MNEFLSYLRFFKWFVLAFLLVINAVIIPIKIREHNFLEILLVITISTFIILILFGLDHYFNSMALTFDSDNEFAYLNYSTDKIVSFKHCDLKYIKCGWMRYIFYLQNGKKLYLTKVNGRSSVTGMLRLETQIPAKILELYGTKIKY